MKRKPVQPYGSYINKCTKFCRIICMLDPRSLHCTVSEKARDTKHTIW